MVAKAVKRTATLAVASGQGKGKVEATKKEGAELLGTKLGEPASGKATKGIEARGPTCDRISARSAEAIVGNKRCPLKSTSRQAAATLCPNCGMPGSSSTAAEYGRSPSAKSTHEGKSKLTSSSLHRTPLCLGWGRLWSAILATIFVVSRLFSGLFSGCCVLLCVVVGCVVVGCVVVVVLLLLLLLLCWLFVVVVLLLVVGCCCVVCCCWLLLGCGLLLVVGCCWLWVVVGCGLLLVVGCCWLCGWFVVGLWVVVGCGLLLVVGCCWLWVVVGCGLLLGVGCCWVWVVVGCGLLLGVLVWLRPTLAKPTLANNPETLGPEGWDPEGWGAQNFSFFFPLPPFRSFCVSRILVVFLKRRGPEMCTLGVLELSCGAPAALGPIFSRFGPPHFGASQFGAPPSADKLA